MVWEILSDGNFIVDFGCEKRVCRKVCTWFFSLSQHRSSIARRPGRVVRIHLTRFTCIGVA